MLDPACGSGNFLYVTLEQMKRLEGEALNLLRDLGGAPRLALEGFTVTPQQFRGIEVNPRAAAIAELVPVSYTHLRAHETVLDLVCRLLLENKQRRSGG